MTVAEPVEQILTDARLDTGDGVLDDLDRVGDLIGWLHRCRRWRSGLSLLRPERGEDLASERIVETLGVFRKSSSAGVIDDVMTALRPVDPLRLSKVAQHPAHALLVAGAAGLERFSTCVVADAGAVGYGVEHFAPLAALSV